MLLVEQFSTKFQRTVSSLRRYSASKRNTPGLPGTILDLSSSPDNINLIDTDANVRTSVRYDTKCAEKIDLPRGNDNRKLPVDGHIISIGLRPLSALKKKGN